ncbi:hypothetical protein U1Q18_000714 [Sarracenia purpurea var. burkii]
MEEEFSVHDPIQLLEAASDLALHPGVQSDASTKEFLDRFPLPVIINALQTKGDVPGLENALVACLERIFKTKYGASFIPQYMPFVVVGLVADSQKVRCVACKTVSCLLENSDAIAVNAVRIITAYDVYPLLLKCLIDGDEEVATASMDAIKNLAGSPQGLNIIFPANINEATHLRNLTAGCSSLGRVRVLALVVKLFSISSSVAAVVYNSNVLSLLEADVRNVNDTLVTLSVLELFYELAEIQHSTEFLVRTTFLQILTSMISNASINSILRARAMMIIGRLMSKENVFMFTDESISVIAGSPTLSLRHREVLQMLREQGKVSARLLQKIRDHVQKWYHDKGYACAQVVNFGNLNTKEVVCEVVEGDVTQLVVQFQDKLGNVCEGNTQLAVVRRELPKQDLEEVIAEAVPNGSLQNTGSKTIISAIDGRLGSLESQDADEFECTVEALGQIGITSQGAALLLSGSPPTARYVVDAAFDRHGHGKQLAALHALGNIAGETRPESNRVLNVDVEESLRLLIYETASKSLKHTPSGLFLSVLQQESDIRLAGYRMIAGLVARPWCLMEICSRQEIISIVTDPFTETTKMGMEARDNCCQAILKALMLSPKLTSDPVLAGIAAKLDEAARRGPYLARNRPEAQPAVATADRF